MQVHVIPVWMGTSAVSATSEAFCRWLHYQYTLTVVCAWMDLSALCAVGPCLFTIITRSSNVCCVCVTSEAFSRWLHYQYTSTTACAICTCRCIVMSVYDTCVASCQSEWTRPLCITSEAFCRWQHSQYTPTVVCAICTCQCIIMPVWLDFSSVRAILRDIYIISYRHNLNHGVA